MTIRYANHPTLVQSLVQFKPYTADFSKYFEGVATKISVGSAKITDPDGVETPIDGSHVSVDDMLVTVLVTPSDLSDEGEYRLRITATVEEVTWTGEVQLFLQIIE